VTLAIPLVNSVVSEIIIVLGILLAIFLIFKIGGRLLKIIFGFIINAILGFISIFVIDYFFGIGIPFSVPVIVATVVFGLPAVGTLVILRLLGVALAVA
jgi:hypothetical protein